MTLFVGALLRTIEFVMVTTDASFSAPGSARAAAAGSGAAEQRMRAEARDTGGGGPARRALGPRDAVRPEPAAQRPRHRGSGVHDAHRCRPGPQCGLGLGWGFRNRFLSWTGPSSWCPGGLFFPLPLGVRGLLILSSDNLTSVFV